MNARCKGLQPLGVSLLLVLAPLLSGCATVIHGTRQNVRVETDPPGATASAGDQRVTTPGVLSLKRKEKALEIVVEKVGTGFTNIATGAVVGGAVLSGALANRRENAMSAAQTFSSSSSFTASLPPPIF